MGQNQSTQAGGYHQSQGGVKFVRLEAKDTLHKDMTSTLKSLGFHSEKLQDGRSYSHLVETINKDNEIVTTQELVRMRNPDAFLEDDLVQVNLERIDSVEEESESEEESEMSDSDYDSIEEEMEQEAAEYGQEVDIEEETEEDDDEEEGRVVDEKIEQESEGGRQQAVPVVYGPMNRDFAMLVQGFEDGRPRAPTMQSKRTWRTRMSSLRKSFRRKESNQTFDPTGVLGLERGDRSAPLENPQLSDGRALSNGSGSRADSRTSGSLFQVRRSSANGKFRSFSGKVTPNGTAPTSRFHTTPPELFVNEKDGEPGRVFRAATDIPKLPRLHTEEDVHGSLDRRSSGLTKKLSKAALFRRER